MIRAYNTNGWVHHTKFPRAGMLIDIWCSVCDTHKQMTMEADWMKYRSTIFRCQICDINIGQIEFNVDR